MWVEIGGTPGIGLIENAKKKLELIKNLENLEGILIGLDPFIGTNKNFDKYKESIEEIKSILNVNGKTARLLQSIFTIYSFLDEKFKSQLEEKIKKFEETFNLSIKVYWWDNSKIQENLRQKLNQNQLYKIVGLEIGNKNYFIKIIPNNLAIQKLQEILNINLKSFKPKFVVPTKEGRLVYFALKQKEGKFLDKSKEIVHLIGNGAWNGYAEKLLKNLSIESKFLGIIEGKLYLIKTNPLRKIGLNNYIV